MSRLGHAGVGEDGVNSCYGELRKLTTVDDICQIADADDRELWRQHSWRGTLLPKTAVVAANTAYIAR